ncbi:MAG: hypothetical protein CMI04_12245 [Oceanospirillaceae bacterium]|nr:hypothetical protein [Oceanospirillaceae bacterium]
MQWILMFTLREIILTNGKLSPPARLLLGQLVVRKMVRSYSVKELSALNRWSESKARSALRELLDVGLVGTVEVSSFDRGRPKLEYWLTPNLEQSTAEPNGFGPKIVEQLLCGRFKVPGRDLDLFVLVTLWLQVGRGTLWSCLSSEITEVLNLKVGRVRGALNRLVSGNWIRPFDVVDANSYYCLSLRNCRSIVQGKDVKLSAAVVNILDAEHWSRWDDEVEPRVARQLADYTSGLFVLLFNEGIMGTEGFSRWVDQARTRSDSCDAPHVVSSFDAFGDIPHLPISWSSYLNLFGALNVSAEHIRKQGVESLNLAIAERPKVNIFSLVTIN